MSYSMFKTGFYGSIQSFSFESQAFTLTVQTAMGEVIVKSVETIFIVYLSIPFRPD